MAGQSDPRGPHTHTQTKVFTHTLIQYTTIYHYFNRTLSFSVYIFCSEAMISYRICLFVYEAKERPLFRFFITYLTRLFFSLSFFIYLSLILSPYALYIV